jgi:uncharacterized protein YodC (DUF2158 family)
MYPSAAISRKLLRNALSILRSDAETYEVQHVMLTKQAAIAIATMPGIALGASWEVPALAGPAQSNTAMQSHATPLQSGDLVRLRSGGPLMIVKSVQGDQAICSWSEEDGKLQSGNFPIAMLTPPVTLPPDEPESTRETTGH